MLKLLKKQLKDTFVTDWRDRVRNNREIKAWESAGKPVPPPETIKRRVLAAYGKAFKAGILVETGTFLGQTQYVLRNQFKTLYSIELSAELAARATDRLRRFPQINIIQGDSAEILPKLMETITERCLFWLDGHYSGGFTAQGSLDTPILKEIDTIFEHAVNDHVILIDDARHFNGTQDYPTIEQLRQKFASIAPTYEFSVVNDIIRAHPPTTARFPL